MIDKSVREWLCLCQTEVTPAINKWQITLPHTSTATSGEKVTNNSKICYLWPSFLVKSFVYCTSFSYLYNLLFLRKDSHITYWIYSWYYNNGIFLTRSTFLVVFSRQFGQHCTSFHSISLRHDTRKAAFKCNWFQ